MASLASAPGPINQLVVCYPGRFQPCGAHHATTFRLLKAKFSAVGAHTYMVSSNKVELPKSPLTFEEKKLIINAHGIQEIVQVRSPYMAHEVLQDYDPATTAVIFAVGKKDMIGEEARFKPGLTKKGKPTYYQYYEGNQSNLVSYKQHGYLVVAPHVEIDIPGIGEMSGTALRKFLSTADEEAFASVMGFYDPTIYEMCRSKFSAAGSKKKRKGKPRVSASKKPRVSASKKPRVSAASASSASKKPRVSAASEPEPESSTVSIGGSKIYLKHKKKTKRKLKRKTKKNKKTKRIKR